VRERQLAEREAANARRGPIEGPSLANGMFTDAPTDDEGQQEEDPDAMELD